MFSTVSYSTLNWPISNVIQVGVHSLRIHELIGNPVKPILSVDEDRQLIFEPHCSGKDLRIIVVLAFPTQLLGT